MEKRWKWKSRRQQINLRKRIEAMKKLCFGSKLRKKKKEKLRSSQMAKVNNKEDRRKGKKKGQKILHTAY